VTGSLSRTCLVAGALLGGASVAAGAFGAHGLKDLLAAGGQTENWATASRYALEHALALVAVGLLAATGRAAPMPLGWAACCLFAGTLIFSGCLAVLAVTGIRILGAIVPLGGGLLIAGWLLLAWAAARPPRPSP